MNAQLIHLAKLNHSLLTRNVEGLTDEQALAAFERLARSEGIIPALESAHAVAHALELAPTMAPTQVLVVNLSGRGDKDVAEVLRLRGERA